MRLNQLIRYGLAALMLLIASPFPSAFAEDWDQGDDLDSVDQGTFGDEAPVPTSPSATEAPPADPAAPPPPPQRRITLRGTIRLSYYLYPTKEQMQLIYQYRITHACPRPEPFDTLFQCAMNGSATVETKVEGQLAKWKGGQCTLQIKVPDIPVAAVFDEEPNGSAKLRMRKLGPVLETWESQCSFANDPEFAFNTVGAPEEWINQGLAKTKEAIDKLSLHISSTLETETSFTATVDGLEDDIARADVSVEGSITTDLVQAE